MNQSPLKVDEHSKIVYVEGDPKRFCYHSSTDTRFVDLEKIKDLKVNLPEIKEYKSDIPEN